MTSTTTRTIDLCELELVVVAHDQASTLDTSVRRLHEHLRGQSLERFPRGWRITIADHASTDATGAIAHRLAHDLSDVSVVHLSLQADRKELRSQWAASEASIAAFVTLTPSTDLEAVLAPLASHSATARGDRPRGLTRRAAIFAAGGVGLTALLAACGRNSSSDTAAAQTSASSGSSPTTGSATATTAATAAAASVVLAPEMTEGPYYLDLDLVRSDVREDREGAPLALGLSVIDVNTGAPVSGAAVDIWHCDANGYYSGFVSQSAGANGGGSSTADDGTFLRGTQLTDSSGNVAFTTIYPGWYQGRTVHIHVKVHVNGSEIHTGQLFFDDSFTDEVFASTAPYSSRGARSLRNADDQIFAGGGDASTLAVTKDGDTYKTTLAMGVSA